jgi:hypothetical protein
MVTCHTKSLGSQLPDKIRIVCGLNARLPLLHRHETLLLVDFYRSLRFPVRNAGEPIWLKLGGVGSLLIPYLHVLQFSLAVLEG